MTKSQIQLAWKKVISEIRKRPKIGTRLNDKNISRLGDVLLFAQVLLSKIGQGENVVFNEAIYKKTMNFYRLQMKKYARSHY